jgi:hypothetical protein
VAVVERTGGIIDLGREHFDTELGVGEHDRVAVGVGNVDDHLMSLDGPYDLVVVDAAALAPIGGATGLSRAARAALASAVAPGGVLAWGPHPPEPGNPERVDGWDRVVFQRGVERRDGEAVIIQGPSRLESLPDSFEGFVRWNGDSAAP